MAKVEGASAIMVGDSVYDAQAAAKLNIPTLGVRTGGFSVGELDSELDSAAGDADDGDDEADDERESVL